VRLVCDITLRPLVCLGAMLLMTQHSPAATADPTKTAYDFGAVPVARAAPISHTFSLTNNGRMPMTVDAMRTSCSCTTAAVVEYGNAIPLPVVIPPGAASAIAVTVNPLGFSAGPIDKYVSVYLWGQDGAPAFQFEMTGYLTPSPDPMRLVRAVPELADFGRVAQGQHAFLLLRVTGTPLDALTVASGSPAVTAAFEGTASGGARTLRVALAPDAPPGSLETQVTLTGPIGGQLVIPVTATIAEPPAMPGAETAGSRGATTPAAPAAPLP